MAEPKYLLSEKKDQRTDSWGDRREIPWQLLARSRAMMAKQREGARIWINGREVDPDPRFAHLGHVYE